MIVESGNLCNMPERLDIVTSILKELKYDAVGFGETDLSAAPEEYFKMAAKNGLTVIDASPNAKSSTVPYIIKDIDGVKVGIFSFNARPANGDENGYVVRKSLYAAYKSARSESDILIVLDQANMMSREWLERNAERLGQPDIVVGGIARSGAAEDVVIGRTHLVPTGVQGKHIGVADVELVPGEVPKVTVQKIPIEATVAEEPSIAKRVSAVMGPEAAAHAPQRTIEPSKEVIVQDGKPYYPPVLCKTCHVNEYEQWRQTKHAHGVATLVAQNRSIPECLNCHSEQYRRLKRVTLSNDEIGGVECATCHIGSLPHGMERKNTTMRAKVDTKLCIECHDKQWSPNYEEGSYLTKVMHGVKEGPQTAKK